jgi:hypothetical protein
MSLYGAFDQTKHFEELSVPLASQGEGVLSPAVRRALALENLFGSDDFSIDANGLVTISRSLVGGDSGKGVDISVAPLAGAGFRQGAVFIGMSRALGQDFTWDGNPDAGLKMQVYNYADNADGEGAVRGLDIAARNRGLNVSWVNGASIGVRNDSGKTAYQLIGIQTRLENYGTLETEAVGLDINMSIENDTGAPVKDAIRVRNTDASGMSACNAVLAVSNTSTNGFTYLLDINGMTAANGTLVSTSGTAAATWSGRLRIIMPDGNAGFINIYSASNEA